MPQHGRGVKICFGDVYATWAQIAFATILLLILALTTIDLLTKCVLLSGTEDFLRWLESRSMLTFLVIFVAFGAISIVLLLPQTVLFLAAGYACSSRIENPYLAFFVGFCLSSVTFILGATIAFQLARSVLPPSCTRKLFRHFAILDGLDHALRQRGRRINILLRMNPLAPYNALNYGLGLTSTTLREYLEGMVGAVPYTCIAVYAGMIISSIEDIDTMFSHTSPLWYCLYAVLAVICVLSFVALIKYTGEEMKAAVAAADPRSCDSPDSNGDGGLAVDGEIDFGEVSGDATMFGTFSARDGDGGGGNVAGGYVVDDEELQTFRERDGVSRAPLLGKDAHRRGDRGVRGGAGGSGGGGRKPSAIIDV